MVNGRQRRWSIRRLSVELPEEADVEDIVETGSRRKSQADGNLIDELRDAVGTVVPRLELAGDRLG